MSTCKICGAINPELPEIWPNWECDDCYRDQFQTYAEYTPPETQIFNDEADID